jgi:hypothetical protein
LLGDFNAKGGREDILKPIIGNESLHEASNDTGVRVVNFTTSKNLLRAHHFHTTTFINTLGLLLMVSHIIRSCPDRQKTTFKHIRCSLLQRSCDTDHYLVVAKLRERIPVSK